MWQDTSDFTQYPKKISLTDKAIMALWILLLASICFAALVFVFAMPAEAIEINPSVDNQPIQCRYTLTKWLCDTSKPGAQGIQGPPGPMNMTPNMTAGPQGPAGVGGGQVLYFHHEASPSPTGYEGLEIIPAGSAEEDESLTITNADGIKVIDPYITLAGYPGQTTWQAGLWRFRTFHYVDNPMGVTTFVFTVYNRTVAGNMTKLFDVVSEDINAATPTEYLTAYVQQTDFTTNNTDRMVINVSVNTSSVSAKTAHFVYEGAIHTSHVQTPLPLSYIQVSVVNESYAYLPGRVGGQVLTGGTQDNDDLVLNGTSSEIKTTSLVNLQPNGGSVLIGNLSTTPGILTISKSKGPALIHIDSLIGQEAGIQISDTYGTNNRWEIYQQRLVLESRDRLSFYSYGLGAITVSLSSRGNLSVGTTTPTAQFEATDTVRLRKFGAGTATFDAGGNITSVSDAKAKTNIATYPAGLAQVLQLSPKQYKYSPDSGLDTQNTYVGFIAQDVEKVLPDAVKTKDDVKYEQKLSKKGATAGEDEYETVEVKTGTQTKSLDDRAIIAALVNAVKEQQAEINVLNERIKKLEVTKT